MVNSPESFRGVAAVLMTMNTMPMPVLPQFADLHIDSAVPTDIQITILATTLGGAATCPRCGQRSQQVHSTYRRRLHDLPWGGLPVQLAVQVRRFFCRAVACPQRTFVEQVAGLTQRHAQRTSGLNAALQALGLALGGNAGAHLGAQLGFSGSATTILRRVRRVAPASMPAPRVVGIDDWALRKGQRYGTVIVDLERHQALEVLPDYTPAGIAAWLRQHPSIEVIARDRAGLYTDAIAQGAPQAQQVADRWHLTQNLSGALREVLGRHTTVLREVAQLLAEQQRPTAPAVQTVDQLLSAVDVPGHVVGPVAVRQHQFAEAKRLHALGWSVRRIAQELRIHRRTATRYVAAAALPRRVLPQTTSGVAPFLDYVRGRWADGVQAGPQLLAEVQAMGYRGSLASIYRALKPWRTGDGRQHRHEPPVPRVATRSPRQAAWILLRVPEELPAADAAYRAALCAHSPTLATAAALAQRFLRLVRERQVDALDSWLAAAAACEIKELVHFAQSLRRDYAAVRAALALPWSNGQTEPPLYVQSFPTP